MTGSTRPEAGVGSPLRGLLPVVLLVLAPACAPVTGGVATTADVAAHVFETLSQPDGGHRWQAGTELRVDVSRLASCDRAAVFRAFDEWLTTTRTHLAVRSVDGSEPANVVFLPASATEVRFRGRTRLQWDGPWVTGATVEVVLARNGTPVSGAERERILVHEVGHVLGLAHSPRFASIMNPDPSRSSVDETDRAALAFLYGAPTAAEAILTVAAPAPELH